MNESILSIVEEEDLDSISGVENAMRRMRNISDFELGYYRVVESTNQGLGSKTKEAVALAAFESQRRSDAKTTYLTLTSTLLSGAFGLAGVFIGALISGGI